MLLNLFTGYAIIVPLFITVILTVCYLIKDIRSRKIKNEKQQLQRQLDHLENNTLFHNNEKSATIGGILNMNQLEKKNESITQFTSARGYIHTPINKITTIDFNSLVQDTTKEIINTIHNKNNDNIRNINNDHNDINNNRIEYDNKNEITRPTNTRKISDTKSNNNYDYIPAVNNNNDTTIKNNNKVDIHKSKNSMTRLEIIHQQKQPYVPSFKSRCEFWPGCTNNHCKYYHPFMNCRNGKSCPFGKKCIFLHPDDCFDYQQLKKNQRKIKGGQKNQDNKKHQQNNTIIKEKDQQQQQLNNNNNNNKSNYKKKKKQAKKKELIEN